MFDHLTRPKDSAAYAVVRLAHCQLSLSFLESGTSHIFKNVDSLFKWLLGLGGAFEDVRGCIVIWIRPQRWVSFIDGMKMLLSWVSEFLFNTHAAVTC